MEFGSHSNSFNLILNHSMYGHPSSDKIPFVRYLHQSGCPPHPPSLFPNVFTMDSSLDVLAQPQLPNFVTHYSSNGCQGNVRRLAPFEDQGRLGINDNLQCGQKLDNYLLALQPKKFVHYTASCLAKRSPPWLGRCLPPLDKQVICDKDIYSNYCKAKAWKNEASGLHCTSPLLQMDCNNSIHHDTYQSRKRKRGARNKQDAKQSSTKRNAKQSIGSKKEQIDLKEEDCNHQPEEYSEMESLGADLSNFEDEKRNKFVACASTFTGNPLPGMIFGCSSATFHECMRLRLFGLPAKNKNDVMQVAPGTKVFLFNFDTKELSGIFEATCHGGWQIQPNAFQKFGSFPSQVEVCCVEQCPNLPQSLFRPLIKDNYISQTKFKFNLSLNQVQDLTKLFKKAARERSMLRVGLEDQFFQRSYLQ